jgi:primosomal protein N' (replication factor Y)
MQESLDYSQIVSLLGVKHLYSILKSLVGKEAVILYEEVKEKIQTEDGKENKTY